MFHVYFKQTESLLSIARSVFEVCVFETPVAFLRWKICRNSSRGVWTKELRRTPGGAVALVIPEDDDVTIPEEPEDEDEGVTPEDEAEFTACLKSGCWIICLTRLSKQFVFAILGRQIPAKTRGRPFRACAALPLHWRETQQAQAETA